MINDILIIYLLCTFFYFLYKISIVINFALLLFNKKDIFLQNMTKFFKQFYKTEDRVIFSSIGAFL